MASRKITRQRARKLEEMGEEAIWDGYLELGGVHELVNDIFEPHGKGATHVSPRCFYTWLDAVPGRRARWKAVMEMKGDAMFERVMGIAGEVDGDNYREKKTEADIRMWVAERLNRRYSKQVQHEVTGTVEHHWLEALHAAEAEIVEAEVMEAEPERLGSGEEEARDEGVNREASQASTDSSEGII